MKLNEIRSASPDGVVDLRDPDNASGAVDLEGKLRNSLKGRQKLAAQSLNGLSSKFNLGVTFSVGEISGFAGDFIKVKRVNNAALKGTKIQINNVDVELRNGDTFSITLNGSIPLTPELKELNVKASKELGLYSYHKFINSTERNTILTFGSASGIFSDEKTTKLAMKNLSAFIKIIKSVK